jgi:hypothetical protein
MPSTSPFDLVFIGHYTQDTIVYPHKTLTVDGGGYTTALVLLNTSGAVEAGTLQIFDDSGARLAVNQVGGVRDSSFKYSIPVGGVFLSRRTDSRQPPESDGSG